jgi:hypothetical protein
VSEVLIGPPDCHVLGGDSVGAKVASIRHFGQVQRTAVVFTPDTIWADGMIDRSNASCQNDGRDQQKQPFHCGF